MAPLIPPDLVLVSLTPSIGLPNSGSLSLHDPINPKPNHPILSLKQNGEISQHCLAAIPSNANKAGMIISSDWNKTVLNVWTWQNPSPLSKLILPSPLTCLALSPQGSHLACGTSTGLLLFYHLSTGQILSSFSAHYRSITVLKFTRDGKALISASQDSRISVWSCASLVNHQEDETGAAGGQVVINPYTTFNDHSLPITDIVCEETTGFLRGRVWSSSLDGTVKLWSLATRTLISTFVFPNPISSIVVDPLGRFFVASASKKSASEIDAQSESTTSSSGGKAYRVDLFRKKTTGGFHGKRTGWERVGGDGIGGVERWKDQIGGEDAQEDGDEDREDGIGGRGRVINTRNPITSMLLLPSTTHLLIGTSNGTLILSDVKTCQILKSTSLIPTTSHSSNNSNAPTNPKSKKSTDHQFNTITNIQLIPKPYDLHSTTSNSNLNLSIDGMNSSIETNLNSANLIGCNIQSQPVRPLPLNLDRVEKSGRNGSLAEEMLPVRIEEFKGFEDSLLSQDSSEMEAVKNELALQTDGFGVVDREEGNASIPASSYSAPYDGKEREINLKEIENLRKQLNEAKSLNEEMWKRLVESQGGENEVEKQDEEGGDDQDSVVLDPETGDQNIPDPSAGVASSSNGKEKNQKQKHKKGKKRRAGE